MKSPFRSNRAARRSSASFGNGYFRSLRVENLESRELLTAVSMTDYEQLMLELVNRAREDPLAEVARNSNVGSLNEGLPAGTISSAPKQPLASVQELVDSGRLHAIDMLENDYFSHYTQPGNATPTDRAAAQGYSGSVGENIARSGSTGPIDHNDRTITAHENLFRSPGHRENLLRDSYEESGMSVEFGRYHNGTYDMNSIMVVQSFGYNSGNPYLTGVAFNDSVLDDDFYSVGESEAGITITAVNDSTGATFTTTTGVSGGYNVKLPAGSYTVTASGGSLSADMVVGNVVINSLNVKVDFDTSTAPEAAPEVFPQQDLLGFNTGEEFWVGRSDGERLSTAYYGDLPSSTTYGFVAEGDFNGDGIDDVVARADDRGTLYVVTVNGSTATPEVGVWGSLTTVTEWDIFVGDFNGDGLDDLMVRAASDGTFWQIQSTGTGFVNSYWGRFTNSVTWLNLEEGDYNGDGRSDIMGRAEDGTWWAAVSTGSSFVNSFWTRWSRTVEWYDVRVGDFNGDGMDDIAGRAGNRSWWVNRSVGDRFIAEYWGGWTSTVYWADVTVGDFDGDGRDDIAGRANGQWWLAMSNGAQFGNQLWGYWTTGTTWHDVSRIDINADGRDDIIGRAANGQWWVFESNGVKFVGRLAATWSPGATWSHVLIGNFYEAPAV